MTARSLLRVRSVALALLAVLFLASSARAEDYLCDPGDEDCRNRLIQLIRAEEVGIDVAFWFMEDQWYANELISKWQAGVPVRVLMDFRATATYPRNGPVLDSLRTAGIPMRERFTGGILHWKMMLFSGQNTVQFSGANYSPDAFLPLAEPPYSNYVDEAIFFTDKPSIVNSFRTKYDDLWLNTTSYRDYANITPPLARAHGIFPKDPELNFPPGESYANRSVERYYAEPQKIDAIMYRITDQRHTNAIIAAINRGIPVRLISEPRQYREPTRLWHSWNIDRLYMAGVAIKHRKHAGLNHQKSVLLYGQGLTIFGSSNWTSASAESQDEHNLFTYNVAIFQWFEDQFERKWNNTSGVIESEDFVPLPPAQPKSPLPAANGTGVPTILTLQWEGGFFAHKYDLYLGTSTSPPLIASDLPLGPSTWDGQRQSLTLQTPLQPGTQYYWQVVGKTMANMTASSPMWTFTTEGAPPPPPSVAVVRGPYLQQVTATGAMVVWATSSAGIGEVRATSSSGTVTTTATTTLYQSSATGIPDYYQHEALLTALSPSTTYAYDILVGGVDANPQLDQLTTAPAVGTGSVRFVAFGDSGTGSAEQRQIASLLETQPFDLMLHGGDVAYGEASGVGGATHQTMNDWFFSIYRNSLRSRPVFPSLGNHDSRASNADGRPYLDMFVLPRNGGNGAYADHAERYYSFDYGPMHVVVLDTELALQDANRRAEQLAWLEADLSGTTQPWKIALYHRSPFSAGGVHGSALDVRAAFGPVLERHHVQVSLSAHEHDYERTLPWKVGSDPDGTPVTYIVSGGGGGPLYAAGSDTWTAVSASRHHFVRGTVSACTLVMEAVGTDGSVFDSVTLNRCPSGAGDIVLYAADATVMSGGWQRENDDTAAGDAVLRHPNAFAPKRSTPLADPRDYFELTFQAEANVPYHVWVRGKADGDYWANDSVFVQFSGATTYAIGTTSAADVNLEDCSGCGLSGWGWQDNGWGIGVFGPHVTFSTAGTHTLRVQTREDGLAIDQIILSPASFLSQSPGALENDMNIYPRSSGGAPPPDTQPPVTTVTTPANGAAVSGVTAVTATASDNIGVTRVELWVDGVLASADTAAPYTFNWDTPAVSNGSHTLQSRAYDAAGQVGTSPVVTITVSNTPPSGPREIVLYAADASVIVGRWRRELEASAAGGALMRHPNDFDGKITTAAANPADYFELTFTAEANVPYHLWIRGRADANHWANDSVFVQFSSGTPYTTGTTSAADVNLEDCSGCGISGWGWQDNGWGVGVSGPNITFSSGGLKTIRVQTREDGLSIDQIVLSPATYLSASPGTLRDDDIILPRQ